MSYKKKITFEQFVLVPQRTLEGRCCLFSSSQLLALTAAKAGSGRALFWTDPKKYAEGRGAEGVRKLDRKTDSDRWDWGTETPSNVAGAVFCVFLTASLRALILPLCKPRRCPNPHLACSNGPPCGWHLWLLWWCSRSSLPPTRLLPPLHTRGLQPVGSDRASWRGRWFSWMSTPAVRSESSTTTSCLCSWTPRSSKMVGWTFWGTGELSNNIALCPCPPPKCSGVLWFFDSLSTQPRCLNCHRMSQYASSSLWTLSSLMLHNTEWLSARLASRKPIR